MYTSLKDTNTNVVYAWINNETKKEVILSQNQWKPESEWTDAEIETLFTPMQEAKIEAEPELPLEIQFTDDYSNDD